jgi:F-type H+-transporting ATPase subunit delta
MQNPRVASRYAKSLIDLAVQLQQLEPVYQDMLLLQSVCSQNPDFVNLLKSPIVSADRKEKIFSAIFGGKVNVLTEQFSKLLIRKGRENVLPEVIRAWISQYRRIKNITKVKITTAVPVDDKLKAEITGRIKTSSPLENIALETAVDEDLIGGFVLEMENTLFDASIRHDLEEIKKQFSSNIYVRNIR